MNSISTHSDAPGPAGRSRRRARLLVAATAAVALSAGGIAVADDVGRGAVAGAPAIRIDDAVATGGSPAPTPGGGYAYPVETQPRCENLDNFGGASKSFGAGQHQGVDIATEEGQEVYAVTDGVLYRRWTDLTRAPGLGWGLHGDDDTKFRYYHLAGFAPGLRVGSRVERGQVIGYVGDTGNASPGGWHLHFEIRPGPAPHLVPVDPNPLLDIPDDCTVYWR